MELYTITQKKEFMAKLLKSDLFDNFEVREAILHTSFKSILDGSRNADFFAGSSLDEALPLSQYLTWHEMRPYVYNLITGTKQPTYFKIILSTNTEKTAELSDAASTFFLNIVFKDNMITCGTGVAYKTFSLDKTPETAWDERIKHFLFKQAFL